MSANTKKDRPLNPEWIDAMARTVNNCPYFQLQSMVLLELHPGKSRIDIDLREKHLQPFGIVHGGVFSSLIDACGWWASYTEVDEGIGLTTVEMKLNYLGPAMDGIMIGRGRSIKMGKTVGLAEARIETLEGKLLAHGTVTTMIVPGLKMRDTDGLPVKFQAAQVNGSL